MLTLTPTMPVVEQLAFGHDGRRLYAAGSNLPDLRYKPDNRGIDVWDLGGGPKTADRVLQDKLIAGFAVNPAGGWVYVGTGFDYHLDLDPVDDSHFFAVALSGGNPVRLGLTGGNAFPFAVHPSGQWFVGAGYVEPWTTRNGWRNQRLVRWVQPRGQAPVEQWQLPIRGRYIEYVACDPAGPRFVSHDLERGKPVRELDYELHLRDESSGKGRTRLPIPGRTVDQMLFSPDGSRFVVRAGKSSLVWDAADFRGKPIKVTGGKMNLTSLAFHASGRYLAATSNDTTVNLYDTESWQLAKTFTWNIGRLRSVAFSPDGTLAAVGSDTGKIVVWDVDL